MSILAIVTYVHFPFHYTEALQTYRRTLARCPKESEPKPASETIETAEGIYHRMSLYVYVAALYDVYTCPGYRSTKDGDGV